ncbi:hypothetical protein E0H68_06330 [Rhizobium leguminosarum bv. viciae]|uniref:hypothetical protein n=1 Tax=Rhizobium leguminosarum TaxID=384 RepID=UPI00103A0591|nr:hypothetical protein [Rhizobium leguminosarum]TCA17388.1 hypothetical protein E0H68_06330 [Rhizobium leguminosarum bv. viciae]
MEKKKKSAWSLLNPLEWIAGFFQLLAAVFAPFLRWLGMLSPPSTTGFENIRKEDIDDAKKLAELQEAAVDAITRELSPAEVVRAYARADVAGRAEMVLSALNLAEQDWLLRLSKEDLDKLGMSTTSACARSLAAMEVRPSYPRAATETETPEIYTIPSIEEIEDMKREFVSARFRELFHAPGVSNADPRFVPATVH